MIEAGQSGKLKYQVYGTRAEMGFDAAGNIEDHVVECLASRKSLRIIFAAAPSQNEVLASLALSEKIDWSRITAFHMDEYIGLAPDAPQGFGNFLKERLFDKVPFRAVHLLNGQSADVAQECARYTELLQEAPIDAVVLGIGENGHIAFNDPGVADFNDPETVKEVKLDLECRQQQVNDGCFPALEQVPKTALTLTIPALLGGERLFCVVPGKTKNEAVRRTLHDEIGKACPATILRTHAHCTLYTDTDAFCAEG